MLQDLRFALRQLRRSPGFAVTAVLVLALGIGANTAIFSWVDAELLRALPYQQPNQLVVINEYANGRTVSDTYPDFLDFRQQNASGSGVFSSMAWFQQHGFNLSGAGQPEQASGADVSANFFATLGVRPALGRDFTASADTANASAEAVLAYPLWQRQFGGSAAALGTVIRLDDRAYTIVGVLPMGFKDYNQTDVFVPAGLFLKDINDRGSHSDSDIVARLKPGATLAMAVTQQRLAMQRLAQAYPETNENEGAVVRPIRELFVGGDAPMLWLLLAAVGLVLLIACANVANLMLIRTTARQQEWAIRAALGAGRGRLLRQMITESVALAALGGVAGLALAQWALQGLRQLTIGGNAAPELRLSLPVLAFTVAVTLATALLFGLAPAREVINSGLKKATSSARDYLVIAEVALALMLTLAAGLTLKSFSQLTRINPGFRPEQTLKLDASLAGPRYATDAALAAFERGALARLQALPGVTAVGLGTNLPMTDSHDRSDVTIADRPDVPHGHAPHPDLHSISPGYLAALGLPLLSGRNVAAGDQAGAPLVALVNASFARQFWPGQSALGRQFWRGHPSADNHRLVTIVGVVGDTKQYGLQAPVRLEVYYPFEQAPPDSPTFVLRTRLAPLSLANEATQALHAQDATVPVIHVKTMNAVVAASVSNPHATLLLLAIFGGLALLLSAVGIYGVISYSTQQRTQEIGLRMALGADASNIAKLVGGQSLRLIAIGIAVGLAAALAFSRVLSTYLFGVSATDPEVFAAVTVILVAVGLAASLPPMLRATRVAPQQALKQQ
ncbi:MAG TPA: ABC transporter permease [Terriglobales bacterium]|nr:ABC transporter permease [Terriglobales bacterium]